MVPENRTGPLKDMKDWVLAFKKLVDDFNALVRAFNKTQGSPDTWIAFIALPHVLADYGITDAAKKNHRHPVSDIDGLISGVPGPPGLPGIGIPGERGPAGWAIPGLDGKDAPEPMMIPGKAGRIGVDGKAVVVPGLDGRDGQEPMMIPGRSGPAGNAGAIGRTGHSVPPDLPLPPIEPMMIPGRSGNPGGQGIAGRTVMIPGLDGRDAPEALRIPGQRGLTGLTGAAGRAVVVPGLDGRDAPEPMMIPGPKGAAGGGGGGSILMKEVAFGFAPGAYPEGEMTVIDADVTPASKIMAMLSGRPLAGGPASSGDEAEFCNWRFVAFPGAGQFRLWVEDVNGYRTVQGNIMVNYLVG